MKMKIEIEFYFDTNNKLLLTRMMHNGVKHITADNRFPNRFSKQKEKDCHFVISKHTSENDSMYSGVKALVEHGSYRVEKHTLECNVQFNSAMQFHYVMPESLPQTIIDTI